MLTIKNITKAQCIADNKALCERMPYLAVRSVWTGKIIEDYDYSFTVLDMAPVGWRNLFLQCCEDIRPYLEKAGILNSFYFTEVKEKYNTLRMYNIGAPREALDILNKYEHMSQYICQVCGAPAEVITDGWITSYCRSCFDELCEKNSYITSDDIEEIKFNPIMKIYTYTKETGPQIKEIDCSSEWERLDKSGIVEKVVKVAKDINVPSKELDEGSWESQESKILIQAGLE